MTSLIAGRLGVQRPRVFVKPPGRRSSSGPEAVELAAACGLILDDWQAAALDVAMSERANGSWAASDVALIASRQNGKNGIVEARELLGLALLGESIIHTSHWFPTTRESYFRLLTLIEAHPDVSSLVTAKWATPAQGYEIRFRGGGRIRFIARTRTSGRGLTGDLLIFDEAQDLSDDAQGALLPSISARPGSQAWYLGSAPNLDSAVFHRIRRRGRAGGEGRLAYLEYSAAPDASLDDRRAWAQANPALGIRITEEAIESERAVMSDEMFARERLSISPDINESSVFPGSAWSNVCHEEARATPGVFAFDANPERSAAGIVVVGPGPIVEVSDYRPGVSWLLERVPELATKYEAAFAVDGKGPAASLIDELERRGVTVVPVDSGDLPGACGSFFDAVVEASIEVRSDTDLDAAVQGAAKRPVGDAWVWGRKTSRADISLLMAATVGLWVFSDTRPSKYESGDLVIL